MNIGNTVTVVIYEDVEETLSEEIKSDELTPQLSEEELVQSR